MAEKPYRYTVFTKPWKVALPELGELVSGMGFDGVELPVRPGYPVEPETVERLPSAAVKLREFGLTIASIAGPTDQRTIAACGEAGVPVIRICVSIGQEGYLAAIDRLQGEFDALVPALDEHGVAIGIQNHCGDCVTSALGIRHLIGRYDPKHFVAVWDAAHCALAGEPPALAADIVSSHLGMVNLKNAYWRRTTPDDAPVAKWQEYWCAGHEGIASWAEVARVLKARQWSGVVCLTAEYSDHDAVNRLIVRDLTFARSLLEG
jgi:sugar phosphate isomerase/epimerase